MEPPGTSRSVRRWPTVSGRPGITQGRYGAVGNLELVACDPADGLWVGDHLDVLTVKQDGSVVLRCSDDRRSVADRATEARLAVAGWGRAALIIDPTGQAVLVDLELGRTTALGTAEAAALAPAHWRQQDHWHCLTRTGKVLTHTVRSVDHAAVQSREVVAEVWVTD